MSQIGGSRIRKRHYENGGRAARGTDTIVNVIWCMKCFGNYFYGGKGGEPGAWKNREKNVLKDLGLQTLSEVLCEGKKFPSSARLFPF